MHVRFDCSKLYKTHFWPLSKKKRLVLFFVGFRKVIFFRVLDLPTFNINRLSYISQAKSMLRLFKSLFNKKFKYFFGNSRFEHSVPKKLENVIFTVVIVGLIFEKKVFRAKLFRIRLFQKLGVSFDCSKLYKIHFWPLSEKTSRFNFCRVS